MKPISPSKPNLETTWAHYRQRLEQHLKRWLPDATGTDSILIQAMHYVVFGNAKRLRPFLVYITGTCLGAPIEQLDYAACAIELVHCYSLVHDDLPAMDDDDLRRGQPTCHKAFNEAIAILVGDSLQSLAFEVLSQKRPQPNPTLQIKMLHTLAIAIGAQGMAGGQILDLHAEGKTLILSELETIHRLKTAALIRASITLGALSAGCTDANKLHNLDQFAACLGLAFQIQDDILDIESSTQTLGKQSGADIARHKATYPAIAGLTAAKQRVITLHQQALDILAQLPEDTTLLEQLSAKLVQRTH